MSLALLERALATRSRHFSPFFVLGDPDAETSLAVCRAALAAGATMLELGLPFSDPTADGPAVQEACVRARAAGVTVGRAFSILAELRSATEAPCNLLVYGNLVHAAGASEFARRAAGAGASSLLVPDVPLEESAGLARACERAGLGLVQLCGPAADDDRVRALGAASRGLLYLVGRQGTTGARDALAPGTLDLVRRVARASPAPLCVGFGLKRPAHVRAVLDAGARVAIVGSALAELVGAHAHDPEGLLRELAATVAELAGAAQDPSLPGESRCS